MIPGPARNPSSAVLEDTFSLATCAKVYQDTVDCTHTSSLSCSVFGPKWFRPLLLGVKRSRYCTQVLCLTRAHVIIKVPTLPHHALFTLRPFAKKCQCRRTMFTPQTIRTLNRPPTVYWAAESVESLQSPCCAIFADLPAYLTDFFWLVFGQRRQFFF